MCFLSLQSLPLVPKLFAPSVACPRCCYPNDVSFNFCQQCGYLRKSVSVSSSQPSVDIDQSAIAARIEQLSQQRLSSRYSKQKSALEKELSTFLSNFVPPKTVFTALPSDVISFLVWKDRRGRTRVHLSSCLVSRSREECSCPMRLAFGTVDSLIGKLRSIFRNYGRGSEWHSLLNVGNPAACHTVSTYLADVREEQLKARVVLRQAEPILLADVEVIGSHIYSELLNAPHLSPTQIFVLARDQAIFKALFFAGDRASDLFQLKAADVFRMPDNSGVLLNHCWTKTLREGDVHVLALKRALNKTVCPVFGFELYVNICALLNVKLSPGFLFRPVLKSGAIGVDFFSTEAAQARLDFYVNTLRGRLSGNRFTMHGFRSGAAVSLALAGVPLHDIMDHVGWKCSKTAAHYIKLRQVMNPSGAASVLADLNPNTGQSYKDMNLLRGFTPFFV